MKCLVSFFFEEEVIMKVINSNINTAGLLTLLKIIDIKTNKLNI